MNKLFDSALRQFGIFKKTVDNLILFFKIKFGLKYSVAF